MNIPNFLNVPGQVVFNERGNNLLVRGNQVIAWLCTHKDPMFWLEVTWSPENYPALNVTHIQSDEDELREHVDILLKQGWTARKLSLPERELPRSKPPGGVYGDPMVYIRMPDLPESVTDVIEAFIRAVGVKMVTDKETFTSQRIAQLFNENAWSLYQLLRADGEFDPDMKKLLIIPADQIDTRIYTKESWLRGFNCWNNDGCIAHIDDDGELVIFTM